MVETAANTVLSHCKLCELGDFADPELGGLIREIFAAEQAAEHPSFPVGREYRKHWEIAMAVRAIRDAGALRANAEALGIGAGHEATMFWLTNHMGRVFATDLYLTDDHWSNRDSAATVLSDPAAYWSGRWNPRRLVVQHMNALDLAYEDETFDAIFSSSSIEHFGAYPSIRRAAEEMHRVLKPGGVASISTEYRLAGDPPGTGGAVMFDARQLRELLLEGFDWRLRDPLDLSISEQTTAAAVPFREALDDLAAGRTEWSRYPHLVLRYGEYLWTSVHLTLVKPAHA